MTMAALNLNKFSKLLLTRWCLVEKQKAAVNILIAKRDLTTKNSHLQQKNKCDIMEVKSAGSVLAGRRLASSCTARKVARNNPADLDNSGSSSGQEDGMVEKVDIRLPWADRIPKVAFLVTNLFSTEECQRYIDITEQIGYQSPADGENSMSGGMCLWQTREEAAQLLEVMRPYIPENWWEGTRLSGLHDVLQFERYQEGGQSHPRRDGAHIRANGNRSYLTFQLFLNDVKDGGCTSLVSPPVCNPNANDNSEQQDAQPQDRVDIQPKAGSVLVFQNDIFYENTAHPSATKYVLKGEVLYTMSPVTSFFDGNAKSVKGFFSGRPASTADTSNIIQPTMWFFSSNKPVEQPASSSKPKGIPFYVPQKKGFIYV